MFRLQHLVAVAALISAGLICQTTANADSGPSRHPVLNADIIGADFNSDNLADLAVGVPLENVGNVANAGAVNIMYGSAGGLSVANDQFLTQDTFGVLDTAEAGDQFGASVAVGNFNGDQLH